MNLVGKIRKAAIIALLLSALQACIVAKNYERPEEIAQQNYFPVEDSTSEPSLASYSWNELFRDEHLITLIEAGLQNNPDLAMAIEQIKASEAYMKQARLGYLPSLEATTKWTHQEFSRNSQFGSFFNGSLDQYELSGSLSWEMDIWGRIRSSKRAQLASYLQTTEAQKAVKTRLIAQIATSYYQLLALDEQLLIAEETVENRSKGLETTKALKEAGMLSEVGVQQTEAQYLAAQALIIDIQSEIRLLENYLSILLGKTPQHIERSALDQQKLDSNFNTGVPALLLQNRPDVRAAEYRLINAFELTNIARANFYPRLQITASGGYQSLALESWISPQSAFFNMIGSLTQPIFNQGKIRAEYRASEARQREALINFEKSLLTAGREVSDALINLERTYSKIEIKTRESEAYNKAMGYSEELLNNGLANYLEVLTARENTLNAALSLVDLKFQALKYKVQLYASLGGGWQ